MSRKKRLTLLIPILVLSLLIGIPGLLIGRQIRQERLNQGLVDTIQDNHPENVPSFLHQGADPNARLRSKPLPTWRERLLRLIQRHATSTHTDTALMVAVRHGDITTAQRLLDAGAHINDCAGNGETALTVAFTTDHFDIMEALLTRGADPNVTISDENTAPAPLLIQTLRKLDPSGWSESTCLKLVSLMLERGVDVQAADANGDTPLLVALQMYHPGIAQTLISRGADINQADQDGDTPLCVSTWSDNSHGILNTLLQRQVDVSLAHNHGWNLLCWAAHKGDTSVAQAAIRLGLSVNSRDKHGRTPLMYAAAHGERRMIDLLLAHGAEVNASDKMGWTALMYAAQGNNLTIVQTLLHHKADRQARDKANHWTADQRAAYLGQEQVVALLKTGRFVRNHDTEKEERIRSISDEENQRKRIPIDAHRWIETVLYHDIKEDRGDGAWGVRVVDDSGRRGEPVGPGNFFFRPAVRIFRDIDGRLYAFLKAHHRAETSGIVAIRGRSLIQVCDCDARHGTHCQPLPAGGAVIFCFQRTDDVEGVPIGHEDDEVAEVSRFRKGRLTRLGLLFLPQQPY